MERKQAWKSVTSFQDLISDGAQNWTTHVFLYLMHPITIATMAKPVQGMRLPGSTMVEPNQVHLFRNVTVTRHVKNDEAWVWNFWIFSIPVPGPKSILLTASPFLFCPTSPEQAWHVQKMVRGSHWIRKFTPGGQSLCTSLVWFGECLKCDLLKPMWIWWLFNKFCSPKSENTEHGNTV